MTTAGEMIRVKSRDGFEIDAYHAKPSGARKGGVIVIQEIFGVSAHIRDMADRFAAEGYEAVAPSMYDRAKRGFVVAPEDSEAHMQEGVQLAMGNGPENALNDMGGCYDLLKGEGPVCITGYCYGGTMSWLAAARIDGIAAASCYYGGNIPQMAAMELHCPVICHFGAKDTHIPLVGAVDKIEAAHPEVPVYIYDADHAFARKGGRAYNAEADKLAFERTIALFGKVAG
ncbi:MAG: dienelactone hydrolase family protein [Alphaproteobacteria bacterium]|nr:dienelactone hydrolase family protein [Alphaproteobacteria bacterium]